MSSPDGHESVLTAGEVPDALVVRDLRVTYDQGTRALGGVDLTVATGEVVSLIGANGAGKTTLVRAVTGLLPYYSGRVTGGYIELFGRPAGADAAAIVRSGVSQAMEGRRVFAELSVAENLRAGAMSMPRSEVQDRYEHTLQRFPSLQRREHTAAGYLSGGEQQMLAIGRALMQSPRLLLLDEPTLGLAPAIVGQIRDLILELHTDGTTILLIEQNVAMALETSQRCFVLERGSVVRHGRSSDLSGDDAIRHAYLGGSAARP